MEDRVAKHYSSSQEILLVGEGDFSFTLSLARSFGSASNIVATSLDSHEFVIKKYKKAKSNLEMLRKLGAYVLHEVDATKMKHHSDLRMRRFDRIIYNFPHAGFHGKEDGIRIIGKHRSLVHGFFSNACGMLRPYGEVHVSHKTTAPFSQWGIEELARQNCLLLIDCVEFKKDDFPGYENKRGAGHRCDDPFPLGECSTYKFIFSPVAKKMTSYERTLDNSCTNPQQLFRTPTRLQHHLTSFEHNPLQNLRSVVNCSPLSVWLPPAGGIRSQFESPRSREWSTFKSRFLLNAENMLASEKTLPYRNPSQLLDTPTSILLRRSSFEPAIPLDSLCYTDMSRTPRSVLSPLDNSIRRDYDRNSDGYFSSALAALDGRHNAEEQGMFFTNLHRKIYGHEGRSGFDGRHKAEEPGRVFTNLYRETYGHDQQFLE